MPYHKSPAKKPVAKKSAPKKAVSKKVVATKKVVASKKVKLNDYAKFVKKHYHDSKLEKLSNTEKFVKLGKMWRSLKRTICKQ